MCSLFKMTLQCLTKFVAQYHYRRNTLIRVSLARSRRQSATVTRWNTSTKHRHTQHAWARARRARIRTICACMASAWPVPYPLCPPKGVNSIKGCCFIECAAPHARQKVDEIVEQFHTHAFRPNVQQPVRSAEWHLRTRASCNDVRSVF